MLLLERALIARGVRPIELGGMWGHMVLGLPLAAAAHGALSSLRPGPAPTTGRAAMGRIEPRHPPSPDRELCRPSIVC